MVSPIPQAVKPRCYLMLQFFRRSRNPLACCVSLLRGLGGALSGNDDAREVRSENGPFIVMGNIGSNETPQFQFENITNISNTEKQQHGIFAWRLAAHTQHAAAPAFIFTFVWLLVT